MGFILSLQIEHLYVEFGFLCSWGANYLSLSAVIYELNK